MMARSQELHLVDMLAVVAVAIVIASALLAITLNLASAQTYSDFIVGSIAWADEGKGLDLIAGPVFILGLLTSGWALSARIKTFNARITHDAESKLGSHLLLWSSLGWMAILPLTAGGQIDPRILFLSATCSIALILLANTLEKSKSGLSLSDFSLGIAGGLMFALAPIAVAVPLKFIGFNLFRGWESNDILWLVGLLVTTALIILVGLGTLRSKHSRAAIVTYLLVGQVVLTMFYLCLFPIPLRQPDGVVTRYATTPWLSSLILILLIASLADITRRAIVWTTSSKPLHYLLSPLAIFGLVVLFRFGVTTLPYIDADDYHFGEKLLGWWQYSKGVIPYVEYFPAHGIIQDDTPQFFSCLFYDCTASTVHEGQRLATFALTFLAYISVYSYLRSNSVALVVALFLFPRLDILFLVPFICLWLGASKNLLPAPWIALWIATAPILILGAPAFGIILVACFSLLAARKAWLFVFEKQSKGWQLVLASTATLLLLLAVTPMGSMVFATVRYVVENGPINQLAYGISWTRSISPPRPVQFQLEFLRMSWVFAVCGLLAFAMLSYKHEKKSLDRALPLVIFSVFVLLLIPYAMGRIDPGRISRPGLVSCLVWVLLAPIAVWPRLHNSNKVIYLFFTACIGALFAFNPHVYKRVVGATAIARNVEALSNHDSTGIHGTGLSLLDSDHLDRTQRIKSYTDNVLLPHETFFDLSSRNALYYYLNRQPPTAITAMYNLPSLEQQKRLISELSTSPPPLVLIEADSINHDGGGLALRNHSVYRFILENYTPRIVDGITYGYLKNGRITPPPPNLSFEIDPLVDSNWDHGISKSGVGVLLKKKAENSILASGQTVDLGEPQPRTIRRVSHGGTVLWFNGPQFEEGQFKPGEKIRILDSETSENYEVKIFNDAFGVKDYKKIPISWGKSEKSLRKKMTSVAELDPPTSEISHLSASGDYYEVTGSDPQIRYDLSASGVSGQTAGLLVFNFECQNRKEDPKLQVFWWSKSEPGPTGSKSVYFDAADSTLIVPLDASPMWLLEKDLSGIRIDLHNSSACSSIAVRDVSLRQRTGIPQAAFKE